MKIIRILLTWLNDFWIKKRAGRRLQPRTVKGTIEKIEKQYTEGSYFGKMYHFEFTMKIRWWRKMRLHLWGDYIPVPLEEGKAYVIKYDKIMQGYIRNITRI